MNWIIHSILFLLFTLVSQVGGLYYVFILFLIKQKFRWSDFSINAILFQVMAYLSLTLLITPQLAKISGRKPLPVFFDDQFKAANWYTVLCNRHYVSINLYSALMQMRSDLITQNIHINYLDASFPLIEGYPLLPHLSHDDGQKLDISFIYKIEGEDQDFFSPSWSGYGVFSNDIAYTNDFCRNRGYWQYDLTKWVGWDLLKPKSEMSLERTKKLVEIITKQKDISKVFLEPELKKSMRLIDSKVKFHGCHAVRHDDHIHLQL
jgi:hypothetical protein